MTETIYEMKDNKYPFGRERDGGSTYFQFTRVMEDTKQIQSCYQLNKIFKAADCPNIFKLLKVFKEVNTFHLLYEYHQKSLSQRLKQLKSEDDLTSLFVQFETVFQWLIDQNLKSELLFDYMAIDDKNDLKVWVRPDFTQKIQHKQGQKVLVDIKSQLVEFYETQRKRIHIQIEELFEANEFFSQKSNKLKNQKLLNPLADKDSKSKNPNFTIIKNTLVFTNKNEAKTQVSKSQNKEPVKLTKQTEEQRAVSNSNKIQSNTSIDQSKKQVLEADFGKMSIAEKVLYYKKHNNSSNSITSANSNKGDKEQKIPKGKVVVKNSSQTSSLKNDQQNLSKSSNNSKDFESGSTNQGQRMESNKNVYSEQKAYLHTNERSFNKGSSANNAKKEEQGSKKINNSVEYNTNTKILQNSMQLRQQSTQKPIQSKPPKSHQKVQMQQKATEKQSNQTGNNGLDVNDKVLQAKQKARKILQRYGNKIQN